MISLIPSTSFLDNGFLKIILSGKYSKGSAGNKEVTVIREQIENILATYAPEKLLIDMTELEYEWGDQMDKILGIGQEMRNGFFVKTAFVYGEKAAVGLGTLVNGLSSSEPATTKNNIFSSIDLAIIWLKHN